MTLEYLRFTPAYVDFHVGFRVRADESPDFVGQINEALTIKRAEYSLAPSAYSD